MTAEITPPEQDWRALFAARQKCDLDGHPQAYWHWRVNASGRHIEFHCPDCERPVTSERYGTKGFAVTRQWLLDTLGIDAGELPEHRKSLRFHLCYLCHKTALCEFHHVAPQALYGDEADRYPIVPLCESCHDRETKDFTERLEKYVQERIRRFLAKRGGVA